MENKFDKIAKFVESLERTSLSEDQQVVLLAGGPYDDTTTKGSNRNEKDFCTNTDSGCVGSRNKGNCTNKLDCSGSRNGNCPCSGSVTI